VSKIDVAIAVLWLMLLLWLRKPRMDDDPTHHWPRLEASIPHRVMEGNPPGAVRLFYFVRCLCCGKMHQVRVTLWIDGASVVHVTRKGTL